MVVWGRDAVFSVCYAFGLYSDIGLASWFW